MSREPTASQSDWTHTWLTAVATGRSTMSQRSLRSIEQRGGGLKAVAAAAKKRRVHLLLLEDDTGKQIVAASARPFKVLA